MFSSDFTSGFPSEWFVSVSEELICGLCLDVLNDPYQCRNGHMYCKKCLESSLRHREECPSCKHRLNDELLLKSLFAKKTILCLPTRCPTLMVTKGQDCAQCPWVGEFQQRDNHMQSGCAIVLPPTRRIEYANGDTYVGEYRGSRRHGQGSYTFHNGKTFAGRWDNNVAVSYASHIGLRYAPVGGRFCPYRFEANNESFILYGSLTAGGNPEVPFGTPAYEPSTRRFTSRSEHPVPGMAFWTHDFHFADDFMTIESGVHTGPGYVMEYGAQSLLRYHVVHPPFAVL